MSVSSKLVWLEAEVDIIRNRAYRLTRNSVKPLTKEQEEYFRESAEKIRKIRSAYSSYRLNSTGVLVLITLYNILKDTESALQLFDNVFHDAKENPHKYPPIHLNVLYGEAVKLLIKIGGFEQAEILYFERRANFLDGKSNRFQFDQFYVVLKIHSRNYEEALISSYKMLEELQLTRSISPTLRQKLHLTNAYIQFLVKAGKVEGVLPESSDFKVSSFLKKVPTYRYDTGGYGFSVNIAEFIHRLVDKDYDILIDKRESLMSYTCIFRSV